jgi:hypothetical protein
MVVVAAFALDLWPQAATAGAGRLCNGSAALCGRRYDEVVQAASHNAMAASDYRFFRPNQDLTISQQLEGGVRGLLLDTHYWESSPIAEGYLADLSPGLRDRYRSLLGGRTAGRPGTWLCHDVCALGAVDLTSGLGEVAAFLDRHPQEVVTLVLQDAITAADTEAALRAARLYDRLATPPRPGEPWPTLGRMIDEHRNVVVFAESHVHDLERPWYASFFEYAMDTPYDIADPAATSCDPNRGGTDKTLFLLNHWVSADGPSRENAGVLNSADNIVEWAQRCALRRRRAPTMIAVDFVNIGDVVGAVARLNDNPIHVDAGAGT